MKLVELLFVLCFVAFFYHWAYLQSERKKGNSRWLMHLGFCIVYVIATSIVSINVFFA
ncbi:hypothetical protein ACFSCX_05910 [Bacillus salitolerans]|uniref:Uncharacterized protein n=1 Tax=Bacillus salitolerans TaxID=1437434 RepID=A0ABW4LLW8_9BACI